MKDEEYIIINKTALEKRIEDLRQICNKELGYASDKIYFELEHLLSQSTPLITEIEKAFDAGQFEEYKEISFDGGENYETVRIIKEKEEYISNLKLDI